MFILGIIIYLTFLYSIFDIYFKSPVVKNVIPYQPLHHAAADRLVLFVVDGLRAESFVNYTTMKYLRSIANSNGRWGISHTRVPTESRPGDVALIAGLYEDPSAVFKRWKENPVDFDSVFNRTTYTWGWGARDTLNIFTRRIADKHMAVQDYNAYGKSFSSDNNATHVDAWIFNKVKDFFDHAKDNATVKDKLQKDKIVFFLHLLGTDTSGHTHKPKTLNYETTLKHMDEGVKNIEQVIRDFFGDDGKTTFLLSSDHGMTDWGSHGGGHNHETETPYVIWGSGIQQAKKECLDPETLNMSFEHRLDINQVDLAPLMSTILSIPVPVNSIGKPIDSLLNMTLPDRAKAIYSISRQLASQYDKKRQGVETNALPILYRPYKPFTKKKYAEMINLTEHLLKNKYYEELIVFSKEIVTLSLSGLRYYHEYYQRPLLILVTLSFLGWTVWLLRVLAEQTFSLQANGASRIRTHSYTTNVATGRNAVLLVLFLVGSFLVYAQNLPIQYYVYLHMPFLLWYRALFPFNVWVYTFKQLQSGGQLIALCFEVLSYIIGALALGMSFTYRWSLSVPLLGMGLWPLATSARRQLSRSEVCWWAAGSLCLSAFAFMPVVGKDAFIALVLLSGCAWLGFLGMYVYCVLIPLKGKGEDANSRERSLCVAQAATLLLALYNIYTQTYRFDRGTSANYVDQTVAWVIAIISQLLPMLYSKRMVTRLTAINTALITFYLMMSVAHEGLFMVALTLHVMSWIYVEFSLLSLEKMTTEKSIPILSTSNTSDNRVPSLNSESLQNLMTVRNTDNLIPNISDPSDVRLPTMNSESKQDLVIEKNAEMSPESDGSILDCTFDSEKHKNPNEIYSYIERSLTKQDFRRAFFFVLYIIVAFFGTGNIASLNSFEVRWVTCFVTSYQPSLIITLILLKTFAPFMVVGCGFVAVQTLTEAPVGCLNIIVLVYSNLIGIQLLYNVRNTGSWLEIGASISHYVIVQLVTVFIVIINKTAKLYTDVIIAGRIYKNSKKYI